MRLRAVLLERAHYDVTLAYVGHAESADRIDIDGSLEKRDAKITYSRAGKRLAVVTLNRDLESLRAETEL